MNDSGLELLVEDFLEHAGGGAAGAELAERVSASEEARDRFVGQVRVSLMLDELLSERDPAESRRRIEAALFAMKPSPVPIEDLLDRKAGGRPRAAVPVLPRPYAFGWWITGAAAAILVALAVSFKSQWPRIELADAVASVQRVEGEVHLLRADRRVPARPGQTVRPGDRLVAGAGQSLAVLAYFDATRLELGGQTTMRIEDDTDKEGKCVFVEQGRVAAAVTPQPPRRAMRLGTPHADVRVLGTRFTLEVGGDATRVAVQAGRVQVGNRLTQESVTLKEGFRAIVGARTVVVAAPALNEPPPPTGGPRVTAGLVALYTFREGQGPLIRDLSGAGEPLDLRIGVQSAVQWLAHGGLAVRRPTLIASAQPARKIIEACRASGEVTIEAWVRPQYIEQSGPARIVTLSASPGRRDFTLELERLDTPWGPSYGARLRTTQTSENGDPWTPSRGSCVTTTLTHVVFTRAASGRQYVYVDGADQTARPDMFKRGDFSNWDARFRLALANELTLDRPWLGEYHLVAIYCRALGAEDVRANYQAGCSDARQAAR
ncbi:MAG: FecR domain-containing protein [Kiritimatiellae bacterium]|nr:FecR domain-containing protein [Kiritimatiellia bacterium]